MRNQAEGRRRDGGWEAFCSASSRPSQPDLPITSPCRHATPASPASSEAGPMDFKIGTGCVILLYSIGVLQQGRRQPWLKFMSYFLKKGLH